jgi:hypothetical protein
MYIHMHIQSRKRDIAAIEKQKSFKIERVLELQFTCIRNTYVHLYV